MEIWGDGPLADATTAAATSLGWALGEGADVVAVAPLAPTVAECDALIARPVAGRRAFAWPTISVTAVQQMIVRCRSIGTLTNLSTRSTRPRSIGLLAAAHDQVALMLVLAQLTGLGSPTGVSMRTPSEAVDRIALRFDRITATIDVTWNDQAAASLDVQAAGPDGVLRIETDPTTRLEHNGERVPLPTSAPIDPQLQLLRDAGVIDMLQTIRSAFTDGRPLPHAFSFEFGRSVVAIVEAATRSTGAAVRRVGPVLRGEP